MVCLTPSQIIDLWERGTAIHPIDRGLALLALVRPELTWEELVSLPVGRRDTILLEIRRGLFGKRMEGSSRCPRCNEQVEFDLDIDALLGTEPEREEPFITLEEGKRTSFRLPDSRDLAAVIDATDEDEARRRLAERCLSDGEERIPLTEEIISALARRMEELDPLADIRLNLLCPECRNTWNAPLDILSWLWFELASEAKVLLQEVHMLASAYGWDEETILAMTPQRRRTYITMLY